MILFQLKYAQYSPFEARRYTINANDIGLQPGYQIEPVISGLTFPTAVAFDDENKAQTHSPWICENYSWSFCFFWLTEC